ncbi:MAG: DMT family transporter [Rhodothermales bacterium]|nr:DMT family transporter [Rhodothermales bacterium]
MSSDRRADLALALTVLIWGANFPIIKVALAPMPPFVVNAIRFTFSAIALGGVFWWQQRRSAVSFWEPLRARWWTILGLAFLGYVVYQLGFIVGVDLTSAGSAALILASVPIWTAIISRVLGLERLAPAGWLGLLVSLGGTVLVITSGRADFTGDTLEGNLLMLGAAVLWALYTTLSRPVLDSGISASGLAFFGILVSLPALYGLGFVALDGVEWAEVDLKVWGALLFSGAGSTGVAYWFWNVAVKQVGPSQASAWSNLVPVVALVSGLVLLGEPVTRFQVLGGALILAGLYILRRARKPVPIPT